jgi:O-antigen biosynthesis protein
VAYEIVLLDNGSVSEEAENFTAKHENFPDTRVLRIAEPFNDARINNLGAKLSNEEFLLFMNNDVVVSQSSWARRMVDECLAEETVGAVGAKLLHPNGLLQRAGVVLGVGGVADHALRGIAGDAPGYVMRAMVARGISAVTAACMLVRRRSTMWISAASSARPGGRSCMPQRQWRRIMRAAAAGLISTAASSTASCARTR